MTLTCELVTGKRHRAHCGAQREHPDSEVEQLLQKIQDRLDEEPWGDFKAEGQTLRDKITHIGGHVLSGHLHESVESMFELAVGLAALRYGIKFGSDVEAFVETMIWNDTRFGLTVWCLELMREPPSDSGKADIPDKIEILLGLYLLSRISGHVLE